MQSSDRGPAAGPVSAPPGLQSFRQRAATAAEYGCAGTEYGDQAAAPEHRRAGSGGHGTQVRDGDAAIPSGGVVGAGGLSDEVCLERASRYRLNGFIATQLLVVLVVERETMRDPPSP